MGMAEDKTVLGSDHQASRQCFNSTGMPPLTGLHARFFAVGHPDLTILNGALQPHAALCQLCQDRGDSRGQVYHGQVPGPFREGEIHPIAFTRPISPLSRRTLIPWGWVDEFVRISATIPSVSFPVCWSCFNTIETRNPGLISARLVPSIEFSPIRYSFKPDTRMASRPQILQG
jgi:hypothetical protein